MISCFKCSMNFESIECYIIHLTHIHELKSTSTFNCSVCMQLFQSIYSFKKHLENKHAIPKKRRRLNDYVDNNEPTISVRSSSSVSIEICENNRNSEIQEAAIVMEHSAETNLDHEDHEDVDNLLLDESLECEITEPVVNIDLKVSIIQFVLFLFGKMSLSRKIVSEILNFIRITLLFPFIEKIENELGNNESEVSIRIKALLREYKENLQLFRSEHVYLLFLKENDLYSNPEEFLIDNSATIENIFTASCRGILMPIKENLRRFFEVPNVLQNMLGKLEIFVNSERIQNIIQGRVWQSIAENMQGKILIPYLIYQDDFEISNVLGSKSGVHKISGFYLSFPLLPGNEISKLENILVCYLTKSIDIKYGMFQNYDKLCVVLKELEQNGIQVTIDGEVKTIHFILAGFTGDNLGIHCVCGFNRSFQSNFYCRYCRTHRNDMQKQTVEDQNMLRTNENYWQDIFLDDASSTGIRSETPFLMLKFFKIPDILAVDVMHDIFEGICHVELSVILKYFILEKNYFDLEQLNNRKLNFQYPENDRANKSIQIGLNHIMNQKFKMSASQMQCFVHYLPLMIYDFISDENDIVWKLLIKLTEVIDACLQPSFNELELLELEAIIKSHHEQYLRIFENEHLIPKHHFMLHYCRVIRNLGPIRNLMVYRMEAKHKQSKLYADISTSRRNILLSLAIKWQYNLAFVLYSKKNSNEVIQIGKENEICLRELIKDKTATFNEIEYNLNSNVKITDKIVLMNTLYKIDDIITTKNEIGLDFFRITKICKINNSYIFLTNPIVIKNYDLFTRAYILLNIELEKIYAINTELICYPPTSFVVLSNSELAFKIKPAFI